MRRVRIEQLINGDRLGRDVYAGAESLPLLRAGVRISDSYRRSLERAGVLAVWVDDKLSEGIEPEEVLDESTKQKARVALRDAFGDVTFSLSRGGALSSRSLEAITEVAELIVQDIGRNVHAALALNDLASADDYTMKHSLAVTRRCINTDGSTRTARSASTASKAGSSPSASACSCTTSGSSPCRRKSCASPGRSPRRSGRRSSSTR
jgi:hypothetical protein